MDPETANSQSKVFDDIYAQIAGRAGSIDALFDSFFGFLHRNSDFYVVVDDPTVRAPMGFPRGVAKKMVLESMERYPFRSYDGSSAQTTPTKSSSQSANTTPTKKSSSATVTSPSKSPSSSHSMTTPVKNNKPTGQMTPQGKQVPMGNGGWTDSYYWIQTLKDVTIFVDAPQGIRGKNVSCEIGAKDLKLSLNGVSIINGELDECVRVDESLWNINNDGKTGLAQVIITLEKSKKTWWKCIIVGDTEIDTSKIDSSQKIDEYDEVTQGAIRKLMFEEKQRKLGIKTEDEQKMDELLAKTSLSP